MKTEEEIILLAEQQVLNLPDYIEDFTDYHNGLFNGFIEGYKAAQSNAFEEGFQEGCRVTANDIMSRI